MTGEEFIYMGKSSSDYDLLLVYFDEEEYPTGLSREINKAESTQYHTIANHYGAKYSDVLTFSIAVIKMIDCMSKPFTRDESRMIKSWLMSPRLPQWLHVRKDADDSDYIDYCGLFTNVEDKVVNGLNGLIFTFTCNAPYGFSKQYTKRYVVSGNKNVTFFNASDDLETYLYPIIKITPKATETIELTNKTDNNSSISFNAQVGKEIIVDCARQIITIENQMATFSELGWEKYIQKDFNNINNGISKIYWFRMCGGYNELNFTGHFNISITMRFPRFTGSY